MKAIAKVPWNENDVRVISHLIDMTLESKMAWDTLANLLKDLTTYDPKQVIDTLLMALEKIHSKLIEKELADSLPNPDDVEHVEREGFTEVYEENEIVEYHSKVTSSIEDNNHVNEDYTEMGLFR